MQTQTESQDGSTIFAPAVKAATRSLAARLTAQQVSLVRAVLSGDGDYLNHSYHHDRRSGRRTVEAPSPAELSQFAAGWIADPLGSIKAMNRAVAGIGQEERIQRYLEAALELEILFDHEVYRADVTRVYHGSPGYIADHFTDIGLVAWSVPGRETKRGLDPIRVDKLALRPHLTAIKQAALAPAAGGAEILRACYDLISQGVGEVRGVPDGAARAELPARYAAEGVGLCRLVAILLQLYLQEAGIASRIAKGSVQLFGLKARHAWNLVTLDDGVALVDVALPHDGPFIILGASEEHLYVRARALNRTYRPAAAEENEYTISESEAGSRPL